MNPNDPQVVRRLKSEMNIWVATMRPDGRPHLTPTWYAWHDEKIYLCIDPDSVKAHNLTGNTNVALALEDGMTPIIVEGAARQVEDADRPPGALDEFKRKYEWDIMTESQYRLMIEITPKKILNWGGDE